MWEATGAMSCSPVETQIPKVTKGNVRDAIYAHGMTDATGATGAIGTNGMSGTNDARAAQKARHAIETFVPVDAQHFQKEIERQLAQRQVASEVHQAQLVHQVMRGGAKL